MKLSTELYEYYHGETNVAKRHAVQAKALEDKLLFVCNMLMNSSRDKNQLRNATRIKDEAIELIENG